MKLSRADKMKITVIVAKILLVVSLMTGTTYALFTNTSPYDEVNVRVNAAEMSMDLLQADASGNYVSIADSVGDVFGKDADWEPGQTRIVYFKVENNSTIPVKYVFRFNTDIKKLEGAFEYCPFVAKASDPTPASWNDLTAGKDVFELVDGYNMISGNDYLDMEKGGEAYYAVAVRMLPSGENRYQNEYCEIDVNVYAIQGNAD